MEVLADRGEPTTARNPAARSRPEPLRTPPSMYSRPSISTGGKTPGTEQLAATAFTSGTPDPASNSRSDPSSASMAVTVQGRRPVAVGQDRPDRPLESFRRPGRGGAGQPSDLGTGRLVRAIRRPEPERVDLGDGRVVEALHVSGELLAVRGPVGRGQPLQAVMVPSAAPTTEPADVPTIRSQASGHAPAARRPSRTPTSQPMPTRPPPARTRARPAGGVGSGWDMSPS